MSSESTVATSSDDMVLFQQRLRSYLRKRVEEQMVDDLLQEIYLKATNAIHQGQEPSNILHWLYAIARTTVIDHYRARKSVDEPFDENEIIMADQDEQIQIEEMSHCLRALVNDLPDKYQDTLIATDLEGQKMKTVAEKLDLSESAIKSRASRGRTLLKQKLLACCDVEMVNGHVVDYSVKPTSNCGDVCIKGCE